MDDKKFFDIDEMMIDYSEMTSFNFGSDAYMVCQNEKEEDYLEKPYAFKYGNFDVMDMLQSMFSKMGLQKV